jgi:hypothetical protein
MRKREKIPSLNTMLGEVTTALSFNPLQGLLETLGRVHQHLAHRAVRACPGLETNPELDWPFQRSPAGLEMELSKA